MNRKAIQIIIIFVFIIFSQTIIAQHQLKSDAVYRGYKGKVKHVEEIHIEKKKIIGLFSTDRVLASFDYSFNTDGNLLMINRVVDGKIIDKTIYEYDNINNKRYIYFYPENGSNDTIISILDENGVLLERKMNIPIIGKCTYKYIYNDSERTYSKIHITSNDNGEDSTFLVETFFFDSNWNIYESYKFNGENKLLEKMTYEFDNKGNIIKYETYNEAQLLIKATKYNYNDRGDIIEDKFIIYQDDYEGIDSHTFKYKYDSKGNWIKKTRYNMDGSFSDITKREIEYYDEK